MTGAGNGDASVTVFIDGITNVKGMNNPLAVTLSGPNITNIIVDMGAVTR